MQANKRERCLNWEKEEKQLFRNILRPYLNIIENKDLTTNTNKEKTKAWDEITENFNLANVRMRDKKQLINQWKCQKLNSKKEMSLFRRESNKTGGGPKPPSPSPDAMEIVEMVPQEFEICSNEFDCDGIKDITNEISGNPDPVEPNTPIGNSSIARQNSFDFAEASFNDMHNFRVLENERLQKEHELRLVQMAEMHMQVMQNLKLQSEIFKKCLEKNT